jgi:hypothetical protein
MPVSRVLREKFSMGVRLVAVGYVDDTQRPFQYFCSSAPNGIIQSLCIVSQQLYTMSR